MKVLHINAVYGHGSTGDIAKEILLEVNKIGGRAYVACPEKCRECNELVEYIRIGNNLDHKIHALYSRIFGKQGFASRRATRKLIRQIRRIEPDIIHLHNLHNNYINLELLFEFIKNERKKTVITLHDCWFMTGKCCHFLYDNCDKWKTQCQNCVRKKEEIPSYFFDTSEKVFNEKKVLIGENPFVYAIGCSKWITNIGRQSLLKDRIVGTIYNGVDLSAFYPQDNNLREQFQLQDKYVILGMANKWLSEENKETYRYILDHIEEDMIIFLVGCSEAEIKKLPNQVHGVGYLTGKKQLAEYYSMADVFVNITKVDTFPTVNIEALACGTPVVTYDSGGSAEIINEDVGVSIDYGDAEMLFAAIKANKFKGKDSCSELCVLHARENFDKNKCFKQYIDLYQQVMHDEV